MTRSPYSYHGDTLSNSLAHQSRRGHSRHHDDGPLSLPARINEPRLERSHSLSSISNDSFGSTDREVFERCVRMGMTKTQPKKDDGKRVRSDDRLEVRESFRSRQRRAETLTKTIEDKTVRPYEMQSLSLTRYSFHGDSTHNSRARSHKFTDEGPPSLPARIDVPQRLERSNSLSSLSNDSFGSTDREVFERCVRIGMTKNHQRKKDDGKMRVRSDDRLEARESYRVRRHRLDGQPKQQDKKDDYKLGLLEEIRPQNVQSKNVPAPFAASALADGNADLARTTPLRNGCDVTNNKHDSALDTTTDLDSTGDSVDIFNLSNEMATVDSGNTTLESNEVADMDRSNEYLAPTSANTTLESEAKDELNRSNESYADVLDGEWSDFGSPPKNYDVATLTRKDKEKPEWTEMKNTEKPQDFDDVSKRSTDTWNDNTVPDDVTFPTISGSVHMISSIKSEVVDPTNALPDLLEKSGLGNNFSRPDLTNKLERQSPESSAANIPNIEESDFDSVRLLDNIPEPSFTSLVDDDRKFDSILATAIEKEAARLAAQLKCSQYDMVNSVTSLNSLDLDNIKPPSRLGSLLSLSASGHFDDTSAQISKKSSQKSRKKSLPVAMMVRRALSNSLHHGSSEHLDSNHMSFLDNVKPPSEMEHLDMESSMVSVSSIVSEVADTKAKTPVVFDFKQPVQDFPMCSNLTTVFHDLDQVNPPSLFDEMAESTMENEQTTAHQVYDDCISNTLNIVTEIPSGSENCTPLPSDISSVESTPKRQRNPKYLTPKEKRQVAKDRYQTYTINDTDTATEDGVILEVDSENYLTWTKSESDSRSDDYVTATSESKSKRRITAKQRRMEDRARYQTQTVDIHSILSQENSSPEKLVDPEIERLKQRLDSKKTMKQKRIEDAERFRTRTLSEDIPPSPTFVTKDANFENIETTTGYDSLSSNELSHQQIIEERHNDDVFSRDGDSGNNEDDFELNSTQMQTYTKSFRNYLPVIESPSTVDMIVVKNLKNIEMTESYKRALQSDFRNNACSSDFASFEGDSNSEDKARSDSESEAPPSRPKPKIIKPETRRDESLDSNESNELEPEPPKAIRGRKKALYVSPYKRTTTTPKKPLAVTPAAKTAQKVIPKIPLNPAKASPSAKAPNKTPGSSKTTSANTSPKKMPPRSPLKSAQKPTSAPPAAIKPLPLERQGTFTKEESSVSPKDLPVPKAVPRVAKASTPSKSAANTSPSRLPQLSKYARPQLRKANSNESKQPPKKAPNRSSAPAMKTSASNHSLQSNDSGKTVTLAPRNSRPGSTSSVNSAASSKTKDIESKIAGLWKKVEQTKKQTAKPDKRVWIEGEKETPKLIRSSTFEGQPKQQMPTAPKQKTTIGIRVSQIPSLRPKTTPAQGKVATQIPTTSRKPTTKVFVRKQINGAQ